MHAIRVLFGCGVIVGALVVGANAAPPMPPEAPPTPKPATPTDYENRVVAYINGTTAITREELGEYLIARYGADKLDLLVNAKIIQMACAARGIAVTPAEVNAAFVEDLKGVNLPKEQFVDKLLKSYGKTEFEWREDVLKPRLLLTKLVQDEVTVTDDDLQKVFEMKYGKKVKCRLIMLPRTTPVRAVQAVYAHARESSDAFAEEARKQPNPTLAGAGGDIAPIARHMTTNDLTLEREAFSLQVGDTSRLIENGDSFFILRCDAHVPADETKSLDKEKENLRKEVFDRKVQKRIPEVFHELRVKAKPTFFIKSGDRPEDIKKSVENTLQESEQSGVRQVGNREPQ